MIIAIVKPRHLLGQVEVSNVPVTDKSLISRCPVSKLMNQSLMIDNNNIVSLLFV